MDSGQWTGDSGLWTVACDIGTQHIQTEMNRTRVEICCFVPSLEGHPLEMRMGLLLTRLELGIEKALVDHSSQGISGEKDSFPTTNGVGGWLVYKKVVKYEMKIN